MEKFDLILFDLDGTLTDSGPGIMNAVRYACRTLALPEPDDSTLRRFIGPPLHESFERFCSLSPDAAMHAVSVFREYYTDTGIFENSVYPGIPEALGRLRAAGRHLAVATSKPETAAERVLRRFELLDYFTWLTGAAEDSSLVLKKDVVARVLEQARAAGLRGGIMVGDREHDVIGARENGLSCIGVTYGYGPREELEGAGAVLTVDTPAELASALLG